ncbi:MAG TPA: ATP-binding protein [Phycisphaerales bacterium]|nr:ATP-binding protein [Phycisphaerales bacterium]
MTVRRKTLLVVGSVLTLVMSGLYLGASAILAERFWVVEQSRAEQHAAAVIDDLADELSTMCAALRVVRSTSGAPVGSDRGDLEAVVSALMPINAANQAIGVFAHASGKERWVFAGDTKGELTRGACDDLAAYIRQHGLLARSADLQAGIVSLDTGTFLVALAVDATGALVLVRPAVTDTLGNVDQVLFAPGSGTAPIAGLMEADRSRGNVSTAYDAGTIVTSQEVAGLSGVSRVRIMTAQRPIGVEQSTHVVWLLRVALAAAVVICTLLTMVLLNSQVLGPLHSLVRQLREISSGERERVDLLPVDEVGEVAFAVNGTLAALENSRSSLAESEARFRSMVDNAPLGVFLCDASGLVVFQNAECQRILGQPAGSTLGNDWERAIHPADRRRVVANWRQACAEGRKFREHFRVLNPDGTLLWASAHGAPVLKDGAITGFVGTVEDTTARIQAQEELRRAKTAAEAANRAKTEFLANMSHEIRTPMTAILGFTDLLMEPGQPEAERASALQTIRRNGEHLLTIINDILDLSRIEAGIATADRVACNPGEVIGEVVSLLQQRASSKGLTLTVSFDSPIPTQITNDPTKLRQVLINLVGNAIKFTETGGVHIAARTATFHDGTPRLEIDVIDTGIGMTGEQIGRLFRPFSQADSSMSRRFGGTGLGLSISQKLASLMGGSIKVRSEPGRGSTFALSIEMGETQGPMLTAPAAMASAGAPAAVTLRARVLLAEDGIDNQRLMSHLLTRAGAELTVVEDGEKAVEAAGSGAFDLIIMDMQMPRVDGYAAARRLRAMGCTLPIIAVTAHAMADDREKCLVAGCDDYTTKPLDRHAFLRMCARWVGRKHAAQASSAA